MTAIALDASVRGPASATGTLVLHGAGGAGGGLSSPSTSDSRARTAHAG